MFDAPLDATYVWLGLGAVATATALLATGLPTAPPPDADALAGAIDRIATADAPAGGRYQTSAASVRLRSETIALRGERGTTRARLAFGPVVPTDDRRLAAVAAGRPPGAVFERPSAFAAAVANTDTPGWQRGSTVAIRHVSWGGTDVTLVTVE